MEQKTNLYISQKGSGRVVVFLHGMASSSRFWAEISNRLSTKYRCISLDLLGFGRSPKPNVKYDYKQHMGAIVAALDKLGIEKFHLVGHSMGALIALRLAADNQDRVLSVTCFGMPVFATAKEARSRISKSKTSLRLAYYGRTSRIICAIWCRLLRPVSKHIAKLYLNRLPRSVAEDSVLHTWTSYKSSMENIIEQQHPIDDMKKLKISYSFIYGLTDSDALVKDQEKLHALIMPGGHNGILKRPNTAIKFIEKTINGLYNRSTV